MFLCLESCDGIRFMKLIRDRDEDDIYI
jgi:hypothetical protein